MILNSLAAAFALLSLNFSVISTPASAVESVSVMAPVEYAAKIDSETEWTLITEHAAPHWGLTANQAWTAYEDGEMTITVLIAGSEYRVNYGGGFIEVVLEQGHG